MSSLILKATFLVISLWTTLVFPTEFTVFTQLCFHQTEWLDSSGRTDTHNLIFVLSLISYYETLNEKAEKKP